MKKPFRNERISVPFHVCIHFKTAHQDLISENPPLRSIAQWSMQQLPKQSEIVMPILTTTMKRILLRIQLTAAASNSALINDQFMYNYTKKPE